jgi:hypothetical protein
MIAYAICWQLFELGLSTSISDSFFREKIKSTKLKMYFHEI